MERTTYKKHVKRARRHANRQRGGLSQNERLIAFVDQHKMDLEAEDRRVALGIMVAWLRAGYLSQQQRAALRRLRRQISLNCGERNAQIEQAKPV